MNIARNVAVSMLSCCCIVALNARANEQQTAPPANYVTTQQPTTELSKITVQDTDEGTYVMPDASTGTKTDTPVIETPLNVQSVSQQVLIDQQVITFGQALQNVSGVSAADGTSSGNGVASDGILVRGFLEDTYYRDGFRIDTSASGTDAVSTRQFANIENVEVLKGPGAVLYGLVEPGGVVNIVTKEPLSTGYYSIEQQIGSLKDFRTSVDATGPIAADKSVLYRVNVSYEDNAAPFGSVIDFVHASNAFVAPVIKWNIDDATWIKLEAEYSRSHPGFYVAVDPIVNGAFLNIPRSTNYGDRSNVTQTSSLYALTWFHKFSADWSIKQQVAYNGINEGGFGVYPGLLINVPPLEISQGAFTYSNPSKTYSTDVDVTGHVKTHGVEHTLLLGGDVYHLTGQSWFLYYPQTPYIDPFNPVHNNPSFSCAPCYPAAYGFSQDTAGVYIQDQIKLPYNFHLLLGERYQHIRQTSTSGDTISDLSPTALPLVGHAFTPRAGLLWRAEPWLSLYGNYAQGYGPNFGEIYPGTLAPPTSANSKEVGLKVEVLDGRLRMSVDYFDLIKTNITTTDPNPSHLCGGSPCSILIGEARSRGEELDIQGEVLPGWNVIIALSNDDIRVTEGTPGSAYPDIGQKFPLVPTKQATLWTTYDVRSGLLDGLKVGGGLHYTGGRPIADYDNPPGRQPLISADTTLDVMASYGFREVGKHVTAQLNVSNLLNRTYYTGEVIQTIQDVGVYGIRNLGPPLSAMASIKIEL